MHVGPAIEAPSLQLGSGRGCRFASCLFSYNLARESRALVWAPPAAFGSCVSVLIWTIFVLPFHAGGPCADPHLGLGPLPSAPVGWEE